MRTVMEGSMTVTVCGKGNIQKEYICKHATFKEEG